VGGDHGLVNLTGGDAAVDLVAPCRQRFVRDSWPQAAAPQAVEPVIGGFLAPLGDARLLCPLLAFFARLPLCHRILQRPREEVVGEAGRRVVAARDAQCAGGRPAQEFEGAGLGGAEFWQLFCNLLVQVGSHLAGQQAAGEVVLELASDRLSSAT